MNQSQFIRCNISVLLMASLFFIANISWANQNGPPLVYIPSTSKDGVWDKQNFPFLSDSKSVNSPNRDLPTSVQSEDFSVSEKQALESEGRDSEIAYAFGYKTHEEFSSPVVESVPFISNETSPNYYIAHVEEDRGTSSYRAAPVYYSTIGIEYAVGKAVGIDRNYGTLGLFSAVCFCDRWQSFVDIKEHVIENGRWATSFGGGFRYLDPECCRYWGGNLFYDYRESSLKGFHQLGIGFESLGSNLDFRVNGYFPIGDTDHSGSITVFDQYIGGYVVTSQPHTYAFTGFDAEVGSSIWQCNYFDLYLAAGPYYYFRDDYDKALGGKCRLKFQSGDYLSFELKVSNDSVFNTNVQAVFRLEVPFDLLCFKFRSICCDIPCWNRCLDPVQRNDLIVLDNKRCWTKNY